MSKNKKEQETGGTAVSTQPKAMNVGSLDSKYIVRLTATLLVICAVTALLLGVVNQITAPIITQMQEEKTRAAMAQVLAADSYEPLSTETPGATAPSAAGRTRAMSRRSLPTALAAGSTWWLALTHPAQSPAWPSPSRAKPRISAAR